MFVVMALNEKFCLLVGGKSIGSLWLQPSIYIMSMSRILCSQTINFKRDQGILNEGEGREQLTSSLKKVVWLNNNTVSV